MLHKTYTLLTIDLSMFGDAGPSGAAAPAGEGSAPAAAAAPAAPEVRYGKQPEQTAAPQQTQTPTPETPPPDKGKLFRDLIKGEYKQEYADETQKLINRRFRDTDAKIQSQQPIIDMLDQRYGTNGDMGKLLSAIEGDTAYWQEAADQAGMTVEQYQKLRKLEAAHKRDLEIQQDQQARYLAARRYQQWQAEAEQLRQKYPDFDLDEAMGNEMFNVLLRSNFPMENAYKSAFADKIAAQAAANAQRAVTENIKARGARPAEAGASSSPAFQVKDDVSKLTDQDVLAILGQINGRKKISFS